MELFTRLCGGLRVLFTTVLTGCHSWISVGAFTTGPGGVLFRDVVGEPVISKRSCLDAQRISGLGGGVAGNHCPIEWAGPGVRKEDYVRPALRRMERAKRHGVYFILKSMEQGNTFRSTVPKFPTTDPNHRILARQRSRFTHYYFYIRDEKLGSMVLRIASFLSVPGDVLSERSQLH